MHIRPGGKMLAGTYDACAILRSAPSSHAAAPVLTSYSTCGRAFAFANYEGQVVLEAGNRLANGFVQAARGLVRSLAKFIAEKHFRGHRLQYRQSWRRSRLRGKNAWLAGPNFPSEESESGEARANCGVGS